MLPFGTHVAAVARGSLNEPIRAQYDTSLGLMSGLRAWKGGCYFADARLLFLLGVGMVVFWKLDADG